MGQKREGIKTVLIAFLITLVVIWVLMGIYYAYEQAKNRRKSN